MVTSCYGSFFALQGSGSCLCSISGKNLPLSSSASLMLCSLSALSTTPSFGSSVPWTEHTSHGRHLRPSLQHYIQAVGRASAVPRPLASVSTGECGLQPAENFTTPFPHGPAWSPAAVEGPRVPLLTNCCDSGPVYPQSLSLSFPVWQSVCHRSSLYTRQSPSRTGRGARSCYTSWEQPPQTVAPAASKAPTQVLPANQHLVTMLPKLHCKQHHPHWPIPATSLLSKPIRASPLPLAPFVGAAGGANLAAAVSNKADLIVTVQNAP